MEENAEKIATEQFVKCGDKSLRCGFTTGSAAAMAAKASAMAAFSGAFPHFSRLVTPKGFVAISEVEAIFLQKGKIASCKVQKDGGDDEDATNGINIIATVELFAGEIEKIEILGGNGIGIITKDGFEQKKGEYAINRIPRKMIFDEVRSVIKENDFLGSVRIKIEAEGGEEIAKKTFNPKLGIKGGISILGTSGVVEPMSEVALKSAIALEVRVALAQQKGKIRALIITPGNIGEDFVKKIPALQNVPIVVCSNFISHALDEAQNLGATHLFLIGHAGKLVKIAGGIWNTHSHVADCRMEIIASHAALTSFSKIEQNDIARILSCATVDGAFDILSETESEKATVKSIIRESCAKIKQRTKNTKVALLFFTLIRGEIGRSANFDSILKEIEI